MIGPKLDRCCRSGGTDSSRKGGGFRVVERDDDFIISRQCAADDARAHHFAITQDRGTGTQSRLPRSICVLRECQPVGYFNHAAGVDQTYGQGLHAGAEAVQPGLAPDGGKAGGINGRWVFLVGAHVQMNVSGGSILKRFTLHLCQGMW